VGARIRGSTPSRPRTPSGTRARRREHEADHIKYLQPEPLQSDPNYLAMMAHNGHSVPAYGYALNNPVRFTAPNGQAVPLILIGACAAGGCEAAAARAAASTAAAGALLYCAIDGSCPRIPMPWDDKPPGTHDRPTPENASCRQEQTSANGSQQSTRRRVPRKTTSELAPSRRCRRHVGAEIAVGVVREPFGAEVVCRQHHYVFQVQPEEPALIPCVGKRPPCESEDPGTSQGQSSTVGQAGGRACRGSCGSVRTTSAACFRWGPESCDMCSGGQRTETHLSRTRGWGGGNVFDICRSRRGRATCACVRQAGARALSKMSHRKYSLLPTDESVVILEIPDRGQGSR